jgi:hypothetical protein
MVLLNVVHPLKIYQCTKFHVLTLTGASFASISEVWTSAILQWLKVRDEKVRRQGHLQWHDLPTEFRKNLPIGSNVIRGTHRQTGDLTFLFKESRLKTLEIKIRHFQRQDRGLFSLEIWGSHTGEDRCPWRSYGLWQPWRWKQCVPPKRWYPLSIPHGVTTQKTTNDGC